MKSEGLFEDNYITDYVKVCAERKELKNNPVEDNQEPTKKLLDVSTLTDIELEELYTKVEDEAEKRGLLDDKSTETIEVLDYLDIDTLRAKGKVANIKGYNNMKRENLIKKLKEIEDDK